MAQRFVDKDRAPTDGYDGGGKRGHGRRRRGKTGRSLVRRGRAGWERRKGVESQRTQCDRGHRRGAGARAPRTRHAAATLHARDACGVALARCTLAKALEQRAAQRSGGGSGCGGTPERAGRPVMGLAICTAERCAPPPPRAPRLDIGSSFLSGITVSHHLCPLFLHGFYFFQTKFVRRGVIAIGDGGKRSGGGGGGRGSRG